jgi:hypothetical protein
MLGKSISKVLNKSSAFALTTAFLLACVSSPGWTMDEKSVAEKAPHVVLKYLCKFLDARDLGRLARVSKKFQRASETDECWNHFVDGITSKEQYIEEEITKEKTDPTVILIKNCLLSDSKLKLNFACKNEEGPYQSQGKSVMNFAIHPTEFDLKANACTRIRFSNLLSKIQDCGKENFLGFTSAGGAVVWKPNCTIVVNKSKTKILIDNIKSHPKLIETLGPINEGTLEYHSQSCIHKIDLFKTPTFEKTFFLKLYEEKNLVFLDKDNFDTE